MSYTEIDDPSAFFQCTLYSGTGGSHSITNTGNSDLQPDWVWVKSRSFVADHELFDSVRGTGVALISNGNYAESSGRGVNSFDSDGFSIVNAQAATNSSGETYTAWQWKKVAGVFDIVSYTGNGSNRTISHNLGAIPTMMIVKVRSTANQWFVYHKAMGNTKKLNLDDTTAQTVQNNLWNDTTPTSSVFSVGTHTGSNLDGGTFIAYLFGDKQGMSKMGSYVGNGNVNGSFIYTGQKSAFIMIKKSSNAGNNWYMWDNKRNTFNLSNTYLNPDLSSAEGTENYGHIDILSNGFKIRSASNDEINQSGHTFIYMAFAENPFVTSTGVPATAR